MTVPVWESLRYGFSPVYWLTISGIPVVWTERALGATLPAGFLTESEGLVIDPSAAVGTDYIDRDRGVGVGLSLTFKLLDNVTARAWFQKPTASTFLTADLSGAGVTATVASTTGFAAAPSTIDNGIERIYYTGTTPTTFTGLARGLAGSLGMQHAAGSGQQRVTDLPTVWRGREVTLWASMVDPSGTLPSASLAGGAVQIWVGRIDSGPEREAGMFRFECSSLERLLDRRLVGSVSAEVIDADRRFPARPDYTVRVLLYANDAVGVPVWTYDIEMTPFSGHSLGEMVSDEQLRDDVVTAFAARVAALGAGADIGDWFWVWKNPYKGNFSWYAHFGLTPNAAVYDLNYWVICDGKELPNALEPTWFGGMSNGAVIVTPWSTANDPTDISTAGGGGPGLENVTGFAVKINSGLVADVPSSGILRITYDTKVRLFSYSSKASSGSALYLAGIKSLDKGPSMINSHLIVGTPVEIVFEDSGLYADTMLRALMSSGTGLRSAVYDTLLQGQGLGIDDALVNADSFTTIGKFGSLSSMQVHLSSGGSSFSDLFGGVCGLGRMAVVARPDVSATYRAIKLHLVSTAILGAAAVHEMGDVDLLSYGGEPVEALKRAEIANVITVRREPAGLGEEGGDKFHFTDAPSVDASGPQEVEYLLVASDTAAAFNFAQPLAVQRFAADVTTQALQIRVGPWVEAEVGDLVYLTLTHPAIWSWSTGTVGYTGPGRVVGRKIELKSQVVTLTILIDGQVSVRTLSPAMRISAFAGGAAAPTSLDVPQGYYDTISKMLTEAGANIWLQHYQPGRAEGDAERYEISAATKTAGICRLTVANTVGGHSVDLALESTLTLPPTSSGVITDWQKSRFSHVNDGSNWG